ncbi:MAG: hypothetical protein AAF997_13360 [Myxococcota bacterium]
MSVASSLQACGDVGTTDSVSEGQRVQCEQLPSFLCDEHPDDCRPDEADVLYLGPFECFGSASSPFSCSDRENCEEAEWFATNDVDTYRIRGCFNSRSESFAVISEPSAEILAAAATSCEQRFRLLDEFCAGFSADECAVAEGCKIETRRVLDPDRGCATGETFDVCIRGLSILSTPGEFEFLPCDE